MQKKDISVIYDEVHDVTRVIVMGEFNRFPHDADLIVDAARECGAFNTGECRCCGGQAEVVVVTVASAGSEFTMMCTDRGVRQLVADQIGITYRPAGEHINNSPEGAPN